MIGNDLSLEYRMGFLFSWKMMKKKKRRTRSWGSRREQMGGGEGGSSWVGSHPSPSKAYAL